MQFIYVILLCIVVPTSTAFASEGSKSWTEADYQKLATRTFRVSKQKKWSRAIKYGERALEAHSANGRAIDEAFLRLLMEVNRAHCYLGKLEEIAQRLDLAYQTSRRFLGPTHSVTRVNRTLLYKLYVNQKAYIEAIPLVKENMNTLVSNQFYDIRLNQYLKQLYSLYGLTGQHEKEEQTLVLFIERERNLFGQTEAELKPIFQNLANSYCLQDKQKKFESLTKSKRLQFVCPTAKGE